MYKKERKKYYKSLKLNKVIDNKAYWKTPKPLLSNKGANINKTPLVHNDKVISDDKQLYTIFSNFLHETVKTPGVSNNFNICNYSHSDPVNNAIRKYGNHPSVKKVPETIAITSTFHFFEADKTDLEKLIGNLNSPKVGPFKNIATKCLKVTSDI